MDQLLDKIKERVAQRDSPIRTVKAVAETIGMSEAGFYVMLKRGTTKKGTLLAISSALAVDPSYFSDGLQNTNTHKTTDVSDGELPDRFERALSQVKEVFEEQLRAKDRQIDNLHRMLESVLGKSEGVTDEPLSTSLSEFNELFNSYRLFTGHGDLFSPKPTNSNGSKVGGTPFSQAENALVTN